MVQHLDDTEGVFLPKKDWNCFPGEPSFGGRGITIWGPCQDIHLGTEGPEITWSGGFTCTEPKCYSKGDFCLLTYTLHTEEDSVNDVVVAQNFMSSIGVCSVDLYHSKKAGHDTTFTHDLAQNVQIVNGVPIKIFDNTGQNSISFINMSQVDVWIKGLRIIRGYEMFNLQSQELCSAEVPHAGTNFITPIDYPCNYKECGEVSYTWFTPDNHLFEVGNPGTIIHRGNENEVTWTWTNPVQPPLFNNYEYRLHCLFNFNNVCLINDAGQYDASVVATTDDVPFQLSLGNSGVWKTFYHCKSNKHIAHSVDLATDPVLSQYYNDAPGAQNILHVRIPTTPNNPGVNFLLLDSGGIEEGVGFVNLYRIYKTKPCCPTITSSKVGGGTIEPSGGPFKIPEQGKTFDMEHDIGYYLSSITVDGSPKGTSDPYTVHYGELSPGMEGHHIVAYFEQEHTLSTPSVGGPTSGYRNITYDFSACSEDSAGHNIKYTFNWGDGTQTETGWCLSGHSAPAQHAWTTLGQKTITVKAECTGGLVKWATPHTINIQNRYPTVPTLNGPSSGYRGISYQFSAVSTDPDGDTIRYEFNWGDGTTTTTGYYASGATAYASHAWSSSGTFQVSVRAQDSAGSGWTYPSTPISFSSYEASPTQPTVSGPSPPTYININYQFSATSTDNNGDTIRYRFQWGDGTPDTYTGYYASGQTAYASHTWTSTGTFQMYVIAEDSTGRVSYPRPLTVNIQDQTYYNIYFDAWTFFWDQQWYQVNVEFTVDGSPYTTPTTVPLLAGYHTVTFPYCISIGTIVGLDHAHDGTHDYYYTNQATIYVGSNGSVTASYHY